MDLSLHRRSCENKNRLNQCNRHKLRLDVRCLSIRITIIIISAMSEIKLNCLSTIRRMTSWDWWNFHVLVQSGIVSSGEKHKWWNYKNEITFLRPTEVERPGATKMPVSSGKGISVESCITTRAPARSTIDSRYSLWSVFMSTCSPATAKERFLDSDCALGIGNFRRYYFMRLLSYIYI